MSEFLVLLLEFCWLRLNPYHRSNLFGRQYPNPHYSWDLGNVEK